MVAGLVYYVLFIKETENKGYIPDHADQVYCVNVQQIQNDLFSYAIKHKSKLDSLNKKGLMDGLLSSSITIPSKLAAYKLKDTAVVFIPFIYQDSTSLKKFLEKQGYYYLNDNYTSLKGPFSSLVKWQNKNGVLALFQKGKANKDHAVSHINNVLSKGYRTSESMKQRLNQTTAQFEMIQADNSIKVNTTKDKLEIKGSIHLIQESSGTYELQNTNSLAFDYSYLLSLLEDEKLIAVYSGKWGVPINKLKNHIQNLTLAYHGEETIRDSIITYDYDENFEMVEKVEVTEQSQPLFSICITPKTDTSEAWVIKKGIFKYTNKGLRLASFPLVPLYKKENNTKIVFSNKSLEVPNYTENQEGLISINCKLKELPLDKIKNLSKNQLKILAAFKTFSLVLSTENNKGQLNVTLSKEESDEHMMLLLLKFLMN